VIGVGEIAIIVAVAMLFLGASKLPKIGRSIGAGLRELKKGMKEGIEEPGSEDEKSEKPEKP
jgi:sec-independent protein translocase protein TatA